MYSTRLVALLLALMFWILAGLPVVASPADPSAWAWLAVVGCIGLVFLTAGLVVRPRRY